MFDLSMEVLFAKNNTHGKAFDYNMIKSIQQISKMLYKRLYGKFTIIMYKEKLRCIYQKGGNSKSQS